MIAIVLVGGKHTLVSDTHRDLPLPLVPVANEPIVAWITHWLKKQGIKQIVYSAGEGADKFTTWANQVSSQEHDLFLDVTVESRPLGTAGAAANCARRYPSPVVLVTNGDSILLTDLKPVIQKFVQNESLDCIVLGTSIANAGRFGSLEYDQNNRLIGFHEKQSGNGLVNTGLYLFRSHLLQDIQTDKEVSLEYDCFPKWLKEGKNILVESSDKPFIDMGTPEALKHAEEQLIKFQKEIIPDQELISS